MLTTTLALAALSISPGHEGETIEWFAGNHMNAVAEARKEEKLLLTYFWANTENCSRLYNETMADPKVIEEMNGMVCFSADAGQDFGRKLLDRFKLQTVPAMLVIGKDGEPEEMLVGFMDPATFVGEIQRIKRGENTISNLRVKLDGEHEDLAAELALRQMLATKLGNIGAFEESGELRHSVLERDPKGSTRLGASAHVEALVNEINHAHGDEVAEWDLKPIEKLAKKIEHPVGQLEARCTVASLQIEGGKRADGVKTYMAAWKSRPKDDSDAMDSGFAIIDRVAYFEDELSSKEKKFTLQVAEDLMAYTEVLAQKPCAACDKTVAECDCGSKDGEEKKDGLKPYVSYQIARCQALCGEKEEAIATMQGVLELQPENEFYANFLESLRAPEGS